MVEIRLVEKILNFSTENGFYNLFLPLNVYYLQHVYYWSLSSMTAQPISLLCPSLSALLVQTLFLICAMVVLLVSDSHRHFS